MDFEGAREYVLNRLKNELDPYLYYHSFNHTLDVFDATINIAKSEGINGESLGLMKIAALYHDVGFIYQYLDNEKIAAIIARETLPQFGYNPSQVEIVANIIMATVVHAVPKTLLEQIVKDADLDYLGRDDFFTISVLLKNELNANGFQLTDQKWDQIQVKFFEKHLYYTKSANQLRTEKKQKHVNEIKERLLSYENK